MIRYLLALLFALTIGAATAQAQPLDTTPRIAVMSAFAPELTGLLAATTDKRTHNVHGVDFTTGMLAGKPVVLTLSGVSMVNAAMTTQMLADRFNVTALVFSGIAGGLDPALRIGDVSVPVRWGQFLESHFVREGKDGVLAPLPWASLPFPAYGVIQPSNAYVRKQGQVPPARQFWFDVDPALLALAAQMVPGLTLERCTKAKTCLDHVPHAVVGGDGVSGSAFVDNAGWRTYLHGTIGARIVDMESAAVALVTAQNNIPFIAFRSVSDLAGADPDENRMQAFMDVSTGNAARVVTAFLAAMPVPAAR